MEYLHNIFPPAFSISSQRQTWTIAAGSVYRMPYSNSETMSGIIAPTGATSITLQFFAFETESGYDFVVLSRCTAIDCSQKVQIGRFSGATIPSPVISNTGIMLIEWTSDNLVSFSGWFATWSSLSNASCEIAVPGRAFVRE